MTQEQIIEGNKLIAEFMGCATRTIYAADGSQFEGWGFNDTHITQRWQDLPWCWEQFTPYHRSWDWLMPVVEKIEALRLKDINQVWVSINACECCIWTKFGKFRIKRTRASKKEATFLAVIDFITWHNEQIARIATEKIFNEATEKFGNTLKKLADTEIAEMHILYNPSGQDDSEERTLDREEMTKTEAAKRNVVLRDSGSDNRWILDRKELL